MVFVPDTTIRCSWPRCCSGRDSCMLTSRCMLPWLRSAPYPALCPCEPLGRSATCKPCAMVLVPDSTVHCSRPPARNLDLSSSDHAQGPWVGFIYIQLSKLLKNGPGMPKKRPRSLRFLGLASLQTHVAAPGSINSKRITAKTAREGFVSMCACTEPVRTGIGAVCVEYGRPKWPITMLN